MFLDTDLHTILSKAIDSFDVDGKRILVIIPDGTRTAPVPKMFLKFQELIYKRANTLDYLIALGTHQPMEEEAISRLVGMPANERFTRYPGTRIYSHSWNDPLSFSTIGFFTRKEMEQLSNGLLSLDVPIQINQMVLKYDRVIAFGPVFPHEVAGFSGGCKYFFPGVSGPDMINVTHWLGALITCREIIGTKETPVRRMIERAASHIDIPMLHVCGVVDHGDLIGLFAGTDRDTWNKAADLSAQHHIKHVDKPYKQVLSIMPEMYDDIWTAAKGMYKLEPVIADGGEVIIYAPNVTEFSYTHGKIIEQVGYHVRDYFVKQWDQFKKYPWGVLAHSTHLRGIGTFIDGSESARIKVTLATSIPEDRCRAVNLGYLSPHSPVIEELKASISPDILVVPRAGEVLYRLKE
jgi:lactate racemase